MRIMEGLEFVGEETDLERFKELVIKRDRLKKEEENIFIAYVQKFGAFIERRFSLQIECIKKKKIIALCQMKTNCGEEEIYLNELEREVENDLEEYYEKLKVLHEIKEISGEQVSEYELMLIKTKYKRIAMRMHPDLHNEFENDEEWADIWEKAKRAYKCNDLSGLEEAEVLVAEFLKKHGEETDLTVSNLQEKINNLNAEIKRILSNDPYRYKFILEDKFAVENEEEEIKAEIACYEEYLSELQEKINSYNVKELLN